MTIPFEQKPSIGQSFIDLAPEITVAILKTMEKGWQLAGHDGELKKLDKEVPLTEKLRQGMRNALTSGGLPWGKSMVVLPGTESKSSPELSEPDGRTDIPLMVIEVFLKSGEHDPHAIIECKRVAEGDADLTREYVQQGIDRFCSGKYAGNHSRGFMAGYVMSGAATKVVTQINGYLEKSSRKVEQLAPNNGAWSSNHPRNNAGNIELHHSMLSVA